LNQIVATSSGVWTRSKHSLVSLNRTGKTQRAARDRSGIFKFAIAGYTNAGKSTLLNYLTGAGILAEDKLFATLDPTTRKYDLPSGASVLLTDTVGFIRNLPHHLIKAFRSTLDEVVYADAILVVIDASDEEAAAQLDVTRGLIDELGAGSKPILYVCNKCDAAKNAPLGTKSDDTVFISAKTGRASTR
jgi:GTP-binding protein HflX